MSILSDLIGHLQEKDHPVKEVLTGAYWTGVVSQGCGLASTFRDEGPPHPRGVKEEAQNILPRCEVVGITGTAFINHTLEDLLAWAKGKYILLIGPTTPLTPFLFDYGIHVLSGTVVVNKVEAFKCISQGATFREVRGVNRVTMMKE